MNQTLKTRLTRTLVLCVIALAAGALIGWLQIQAGPAAVVKPGQTTITGAAIGGPFSLTDQDGKTVTEKNYAEQWKLIYFGFTSCPTICPTALQKIAKVMNALGDAGADIQPLFITTDPARDTPAVMKQYVEQFHPRLVGLTGTQEQIEAAEKNYRVYAQKVQTPEMAEYTMDHSSFIYLMNPQGELTALYRTEDTAEAIAAEIRNNLSP